MLKLFKTTFPQKLFDYDRVTLYILLLTGILDAELDSYGPDINQGMSGTQLNHDIMIEQMAD